MMIRKRTRQDFLILSDYLEGAISFLGILSFRHKGYCFKLSRTSTSNRNTGSGGSYLFLQVESKITDALYLGPKESYKYSNIGSIKNDYIEVNLIHGRTFLIKTESLDSSKTLSEKIGNYSSVIDDINELLKFDFQYIYSHSVFEIIGFNVEKKHYYELSFLPNEVLKDPKLFLLKLDQFLNILSTADKVINLNKYSSID